MNEIVRRDPRQEVVEWLNSDRIREQVSRALPEHLPIEWFLRCAQTAILMNPDLAGADKGTLLRELVAVAQLGLIMDPQMGEAWLIVDKDRKVQRRVGYQGLRKLALQSGLVTALNAQAVYANDETDIALGDSPHVHHKIQVKVPGRGQLLGCYAVARIKGTDMPQVEWMDWKQIEEHRDRYSQAGKRGPWGDPLAEVEMGRKTVFRRLAKWLPKSPLLAEALAHEDRMDMRVVSPDGDLPAPEERQSVLAPQIGQQSANVTRQAPATSWPAQDSGTAEPAPDGAAQAEQPTRKVSAADADLRTVAAAYEASSAGPEVPLPSQSPRPELEEALSDAKEIGDRKRRGRRSNREIDEDAAARLKERAISATDDAELDAVYRDPEYDRIRGRNPDIADEIDVCVEQQRAPMDDDSDGEVGWTDPAEPQTATDTSDPAGKTYKMIDQNLRAFDELPAGEWLEAFGGYIGGQAPAVRRTGMLRNNRLILEDIAREHPELEEQWYPILAEARR